MSEQAARPHPIGVQRETVPIAPLEEHLVRIPAGAVDFGVEYRRLTEDIIKAHVASHPDTAGLVAEARRQNGTDAGAIDERGVSIHVFDHDTGLEYLRFDAFVNDPHYHYITPGSHHVDVGFDETANGDCLTWVLAALEQRLPAMLTLAGATDLAARVDHDEVRHALVSVRRVAEEATEPAAATTT